jgi:hypothetical protein
MPGLSAEESRVFVPEESEGEALNLIHTAFPGDLPSEG